MNKQMTIDRICIIGVGLIGGSFALALKESGFKGHIVGANRSSKSLETAVSMGVIDSYQTDLSLAVSGADLVLLAVPMGVMKSVLKKIKPAISENTIITDAGSVKGCFVAAAREVLDELTYVVPGHPIAGTEKSGVEAAFPSLYVERKVILTPLPETERAAIEVVRDLWQKTGAEVECLGVERHDRVLAATSHLPHVLAFSLVDTLATLQESEEIFQYAAGGFHDFTRIASSDPVMWRDICAGNQEALLGVLDKVLVDLKKLRGQIDSLDTDAI